MDTDYLWIEYIFKILHSIIQLFSLPLCVVLLSSNLTLLTFANQWRVPLIFDKVFDSGAGLGVSDHPHPVINMYGCNFGALVLVGLCC